MLLARPSYGVCAILHCPLLLGPLKVCLKLSSSFCKKLPLRALFLWEHWRPFIIVAQHTQAVKAKMKKKVLVTFSVLDITDANVQDKKVYKGLSFERAGGIEADFSELFGTANGLVELATKVLHCSDPSRFLDALVSQSSLSLSLTLPHTQTLACKHACAQSSSISDFLSLSALPSPPPLSCSF